MKRKTSSLICFLRLLFNWALCSGFSFQFYLILFEFRIVIFSSFSVGKSGFVRYRGAHCVCYELGVLAYWSVAVLF